MILIGQFRTVSAGQDRILIEQLKNIGTKDKMEKCVKKFKDLKSLFKTLNHANSFYYYNILLTLLIPLL